MFTKAYYEWAESENQLRDSANNVIVNGVNLLIESECVVVKKNTLLFLGRIHPKKGLDNLIEAWGKLKPNNWDLQIVGPEESGYKEIIRQKISSLNLESSISLLPPQYGKDKEKLFREVSAFILPSFSEALPMVVLEPWAYKLPVIMTQECNLSVGFEKNAAIKIDTSVESIKEGIEKLIFLNPNKLSLIGEAGYELVKNDFTWDEVGKKMNSLYKWVNNEIDKPDFVILD